MLSSCECGCEPGSNDDARGGWYVICLACDNGIELETGTQQEAETLWNTWMAMRTNT